MRFICGVSDETALRLLKWSEFFLMFMLIIPVAVLLYQDKGITLGDFFLIQGLFRIAAFALEIPSGYVSDVFSRRKVLFIGALIWLAGNVGLYFAYGFWQIALCEMSFGFAAALFSGTKEAYAYDLLKRMKREKQFLQENGSIATYASTASFTATIAGGILYPVLGNGIIAVETVAALLAVICTFLLPELKEVRRKIAPESSPMQDVAKIVKMSVKHPEINLFCCGFCSRQWRMPAWRLLCLVFLWGLISFREFFSQSLPIRLMSGWESEKYSFCLWRRWSRLLQPCMGLCWLKTWLLFIYAVRLLPWWRPCRKCMRWFSAR